MRRGVVVSLLVTIALIGTAGPIFAAPVVSLDPQPDGTLALVGSGWRPGQQLVISLGGDEFPALADATGSFEVPTGLLVAGGPPLSMTIRRPEASSLAFVLPGAPAEPDGPNPFALLFAQSLALGSQFLALGVGGLALAIGARRAIRALAGRRAS